MAFAHLKLHYLLIVWQLNLQTRLLLRVYFFGEIGGSTQRIPKGKHADVTRAHGVEFPIFSHKEEVVLLGDNLHYALLEAHLCLIHFYV